MNSGVSGCPLHYFWQLRPRPHAPIQVKLVPSGCIHQSITSGTVPRAIRRPNDDHLALRVVEHRLHDRHKIDLPEMSRDHNDDQATRARLVLAQERVMFVLVFCVVAFWFVGRPIVSTLFEYGRFQRGDAIAVWLTLSVFCVGLVASGLSRILQNACFARGDVSTPAKIAFARLALASAIGALLMFPADRLIVQISGNAGAFFVCSD